MRCVIVIPSKLANDRLALGIIYLRLWEGLAKILLLIANLIHCMGVSSCNQGNYEGKRALQ